MQVLNNVLLGASDEMLEAARDRLDGAPNVDLRRGELEDLPLDDADTEDLRPGMGVTVKIVAELLTVTPNG